MAENNNHRMEAMEIQLAGQQIEDSSHRIDRFTQLVEEIFTRKMNEAIDKIRIVAEEIFTRKTSEAFNGLKSVTGKENLNPNLPDISATQVRIRNENRILPASPSVRNVDIEMLDKLIETKTQLLLDGEHLTNKMVMPYLCGTEILGYMCLNKDFNEIIVAWFGDGYMCSDYPVTNNVLGTGAHLSICRPPPEPPPPYICCWRGKRVFFVEKLSNRGLNGEFSIMFLLSSQLLETDLPITVVVEVHACSDLNECLEKKAVFAFDFDKTLTKRNILVFDPDGGTLDFPSFSIKFSFESPVIETQILIEGSDDGLKEHPTVPRPPPEPPPLQLENINSDHSAVEVSPTLAIFDDKGKVLLQPVAVLAHRLISRNNKPIAQLLIKMEHLPGDEATGRDYHTIIRQFRQVESWGQDFLKGKVLLQMANRIAKVAFVIVVMNSSTLAFWSGE